MPPTDRSMHRAGKSAVIAALMLAAAAPGAQTDGTTSSPGSERDTDSRGSEAATGAATAVVERLHEAFVTTAAGGGDLGARYSELLPVVGATHDLRFISQLTIRRQWRDLDEADRARFVAAFERLSVTTYASRFAGVSADTFRIIDEEPLEDGRVRVRAEIERAADAPVTLEYLLQRDGAGWRIVTIVADGVSDLALKRAQYQRVLRNGGTIDDVIAEIENETESLTEDAP